MIEAICIAKWLIIMYFHPISCEKLWDGNQGSVLASRANRRIAALTLKVLCDICSRLVLNLDIEVLDFIREMIWFFRSRVYHVLNTQILKWGYVRSVLGVSQVQEFLDDF